jgi:ABC-type transport system substrate-binding protein
VKPRGSGERHRGALGPHSRAAAAAIAVALCLASCASDGPRRIVIATRELPARLDPVRVASPAEENACELLFDGLVNVAANDSGVATPVLGLAKSIDQDLEDRALYKVSLREARWHDGRELDSQDVAASFAAYAEGANRSPRRDYLLGLIESVEPDGPRGVLVRFREPIAEFRAWYVLAFKIVPRLYKGQPMPTDRSGSMGAAFAAAPVGTGPFRFQSRSASEIVFSASSGGIRGAPASEGIVLRRIGETKDRIQALIKGKVDVISDTGPLDRPLLESSGGIMVQSYMPHAFYSVAINLRKPALSGVDARRAMVRAVDRAALVPGLTDKASSVELNRGPFPDSLLTKVLPEYFREGFVDKLPYNPAQATRLAASSGLTAATDASSFESPQLLKLAFPASWGEFGSRLASELSYQLGLSHIGVKPLRLSDEAYAKALAERDYDLAIVYHEGYDNLFSGISDLYRTNSPGNETGISDPRLDALLAERDTAIEVTSWIQNTLALHDLLSELVPYIPLFGIEKDLFYRNIRSVLIASDNPFLTAERWSIAKP